MDSPRQAGTPIFQLAQSTAPIFVLRVQRALVDDQTWAHSGAQGNALDVDTFRRSWLDTLQISDQGIHTSVGKIGFDAVKLKENVEALIADLKRIKPASSKGIYVKRVTLSTTMGPGLVIDQSSLDA